MILYEICFLTKTGVLLGSYFPDGSTLTRNKDFAIQHMLFRNEQARHYSEKFKTPRLYYMIRKV